MLNFALHHMELGEFHKLLIYDGMLNLEYDVIVRLKPFMLIDLLKYKKCIFQYI